MRAHASAGIPELVSAVRKELRALKALLRGVGATTHIHGARATAAVHQIITHVTIGYSGAIKSTLPRIAADKCEVAKGRKYFINGRVVIK